MKKISVLLAALALMLTLAACSARKPAETPAPAAPAVRFTTTDRVGNTVDETILRGHKLVMLNFWEPWCQPCVGEMPELEKLYRDYADKGLLILGIYSTRGQETEVDKILSDSGTSYPVLYYSRDFDRFKTGYVPTTVFVDGEGTILSELLIGSRDYAGWEELIANTLK